jgi:hypothetical protein
VRPGAGSTTAARKAVQKLMMAEAAEVAKKAELTKKRAFFTCGQPPPARVAPTFYLYDEPAFMWGERLVRCYQQKNGRSPWTMAPPSAPRKPRAPSSGGGTYTAFAAAGATAGGATATSAPPSLLMGTGPAASAASDDPSALRGAGPAPQADLSHALWLHSALLRHRKRVSEPGRATLFVVPAFGSLSEATGSCEGTTHLSRMAAAAAALKASPLFSRAPTRHVVFAGASSEDRMPLGELGALLSRGGAIGVCSSRLYCSARFQKRAEVPMLPLLSLMGGALSSKLAMEACRSQPTRRRTTIFFRGAHGVSSGAQELRARLWELRTLRGADVKFSKGGPPPNGLAPSVKTRLATFGWTKDLRMPYNVETAANGMLHSDFCIMPLGDGAQKTNPGRRFIDAVAAGCVPIFIGDSLRPPLSAFLSYNEFTLRVPESEFLRYPRTSIQDLLTAAVPRLGELRKNLVRARDDLLLGIGTIPINATPTHAADLVLLQAGKVFCPRSPSTLRACIDGFV